MQRLCDLSEDDYAILLHTGRLWELYPEATGDYALDSKESHHAT